jgi:hypothetical protein
MRLNTVACVLGLFLTMAPSARAATETIGIRDVSIITSDEDECRLLFRVADFGPLEERGRAALGSARLRFPVVGSTEARRYRVQVHPITTSWVAEVADWTTGWRTPGGDIDSDVYARTDIDLSRGAHEVSIDVTTVVRELLANEDYDGFLVSLPPFDGRGLTLDDMERFAEFSGAELVLTYKKTGPAPRRVQGSD